jgi:hypothetical protein
MHLMLFTFPYLVDCSRVCIHGWSLGISLGEVGRYASRLPALDLENTVRRSKNIFFDLRCNDSRRGSLRGADESAVCYISTRMKG